MSNGRLGFSFVDANGSNASSDVYFNVPGTALLSQLQTEFARLAGLVDNVTATKITAVTYHISVDISGLTANTPDPATTVNDSLGLKLPNATNSRPWDFIVPGLASALKASGGPVMTEGGAIDLLADALEVVMPTTGLTAGYYANNQFLQLAPTATGYFPNRKLARKLPSRSRRVGA